jgi:hypothetical protein
MSAEQRKGKDGYLIGLGILVLLVGAMTARDALTAVRAGKTIIPATTRTKQSTPATDLLFGSGFILAGGYVIWCGVTGRKVFHK